MSHTNIHPATATATATAGSASSKAVSDLAMKIAKTATSWRRVGNYIVNAQNEIIAQIAGHSDGMKTWHSSPADLEASAVAELILALPVLIEALDVAHFGLTKDREACGRVDVAGVLGWVTPALQRVGGAA